MAIGDIILYKSAGSLRDRAIVFATKGPFVHVSVIANEMAVIEATFQGIKLNALPKEDALHVYVPLEKLTTPENIHNGLEWARLQFGKKYGYSDIFSQALKFMWPNNPFQFGIVGQWDCSDFVTRYLYEARVQLPDNYSDAYSVTPNDIGRVFAPNTPGLVLKP